MDGKRSSVCSYGDNLCKTRLMGSTVWAWWEKKKLRRSGGEHLWLTDASIRERITKINFSENNPYNFFHIYPLLVFSPTSRVSGLALIYNTLNFFSFFFLNPLFFLLFCCPRSAKHIPLSDRWTLRAWESRFQKHGLPVQVQYQCYGPKAFWCISGPCMSFCRVIQIFILFLSRVVPTV